MGFDAQLSELNRTICSQFKASELAILQKTVLILRKSGILERSLQEGETVPDFAIPRPEEDSSLYQLLQLGRVVINFYRGSWCGFCRAELRAFTQVLPELAKLNVTYLAISPEGEGDKSAGPERQELSAYCNIKDIDNRIARSFGIHYTLSQQNREMFENWGLDLAQLHGSERVELPLPATYVIGPDRTVAFRYVDVDFRKRFDPQKLVTILQGQEG
ncbi:AhpC/TSA family protein [Pseudomaricurvus alkylphenolicus]|uniref:peroxiredoxin-like family protein n=1 Tax=Pseudomaricurvus alkylphenolicus TaxID=1306991 RepID=UPI00142139E9|nr:peroxiredoxin-like family protein [Pseudomaricurvus alkylphenolicus]NIB43501.1 AhpC/TSA family protein [Pseudomaricurvus alkylphenolicus]